MTFTKEELSAIAEAPMLVGLAVAMIDFGIVSSAIEAAAMSKEITSAAQKFPNNSIIQSVFSDEVIRSGVLKIEKPQVTPEEVKSGALIDKAIAQVNSAVDLLDGKASAEEIMEYKQMIYSAAEAVASAAGKGLFGSGEKVTVAEAAALEKLKAALELA
ncbi:MAG: hypothetical protein KME20_06980 [Kaiparowitsia implicata GSE-PSE-MK54-09C]|jgi:hypothetical protein|nr:hypothetical protein [Kaiparowitsia implicata GSE-PSE-MK54-09C]